MKKAVKVWGGYLVSLLIISLFFSWVGLNSFMVEKGKLAIPVNPVIIATVIGGLISLKQIVSNRSFKTFIVIYLGLWILRYILIYSGNQIGEMSILHRKFRFDIILKNYYENIFRITTPMPFIIFWLIDFLFTNRGSAPVKVG